MSLPTISFHYGLGSRQKRPDLRAQPLTVCLGTAKGKEFQPSQLRIKKLMGSGSFGEVFEGTLDNGTASRIVLKRMKAKVAGAIEMGDIEHILNVHVSKCARDSCASFMGYSDVKMSDNVVDKRITNGKWLLWKYQGSMTLADYMRRRDCNMLLAKDLDIPEDTVVSTVIKQITQSLSQLHHAGLVHRDVKPSNIIFCEEDRRFRMIDLGACADLRSGTNYVPDESILDPLYCPPEQYVLPTDAPDLAKKNAILASAISPMLWARHKPDRFDIYSLGLIFLQLAMPHMRSHNALQGFHTSFKRCRYDLRRWRIVSSLQPRHTVVLDDHNAAGWDMATKMLRPREVESLSDGHVYFTNSGHQRLPASDILNHKFLKTAVNTRPRAADSPAGTGGSRRGGTGTSGTTTDEAEPRTETGFFKMMRGLQTKMFEIEADVLRTAEAAEQQTTTVKRLQRAVEEGEADEEQLEKEVGMLDRLVTSMNYLQQEMVTTQEGAGRAFRRGLVGTRQVDKEDIMKALDMDNLDLDADPIVDSIDLDELDEAEEVTREKGNWDVAGMMLTGLRGVGLAARRTSQAVDTVQSRAGKTLEEMNLRQTARRREAADFMELLSENRVTANCKWIDVQCRIGKDPRFLAVTGERKLALYKTYLVALNDVEDSRLQAVEREFATQLSLDVESPGEANWQVVKRKLLSEPRFQAISEESALLLYERHVSKLKEEFAEKGAIARAEAGYRAILDSLSPPITGDTSWPHVRRLLFTDPVFLAVPDERRRLIFEELREIVRDMEAALVKDEPVLVEASESELYRDLQEIPTVPVTTGTDADVLKSLREEQAKLKAEYDRMEAKLEEMESRMTPKEVQKATSGQNGST